MGSSSVTAILLDLEDQQVGRLILPAFMPTVRTAAPPKLRWDAEPSMLPDLNIIEYDFDRTETELARIVEDNEAVVVYRRRPL